MDYKIIFTDYNNSSTLVDLNIINKIPKIFEMYNNNTSNRDIYLDKVNPEIFSHILAFIKYHETDNILMIDTMIKNISYDIFVDLIPTVEYLQLNIMLNYLSRYFKNLLNNDPEYIKKLYNLQDD
jgi:hypothetical protein